MIIPIAREKQLIFTQSGSTYLFMVGCPWLLTMFFGLVFLFVGNQLQGQGFNPGQIIVQSRSDLDFTSWEDPSGKNYQDQYGLKLNRILSHEMGICLLEFDENRIDTERLLAFLKRDPLVEQAQLNHQITWRNLEPNDPLFGDQWYHENTGQLNGTPGADIDSKEAWSFVQGGQTAKGDTIVVCVIDQGIDSSHLDLRENLWFNRGEIPGNGLDDDNNGYVDDYRGWSIITRTDDVDGGSHGTEVSGMVGARGGNGLGVAGINWRVKIMVVKNNFLVDEAAVIEAYAYPLAMRKLYNETDGESGAFVVATNASWGKPFGQPDDSPLWCALYDSLGRAGIVSVGATVNLNTDVDLVGDLPTTCPSDFLISVTSTNRRDEKAQVAGYGLINIDLGAPGEAILTTTTGNAYRNISGTSLASPLVAGTVGLLYSAPCPAFGELARQFPDSAAMLVRQAIISGVDTLGTLQEFVASGGRLNVNESLLDLLGSCTSCLLPFRQEIADQQDSSVTIQWLVADSILRTDLRFRLEGRDEWLIKENVSSPITLDGLAPCSRYEVEFRTFCSSDTTDFEPSLLAQTEGCCFPPSAFRVLEVDSQSVSLDWAPEEAAEFYWIRYREEGTLAWDSLQANDTLEFVLDGLIACTGYQFQIRSDCGLVPSLGWSDTLHVVTKGCGACVDLDYCPAFGLNASQEWIERVRLDTFDNLSGSDNGYGDFTGLWEVNLDPDSSYSFELTPGLIDVPFQEFWRVWIDFNRDGTFSENEEVYRSDSASALVQTGEIVIPEGVRPGSTRLRIGMQFRELDPTQGCKAFAGGFGEYEDYCVNILGEDNACETPTELEAIMDGQEVVGFEWKEVIGAESYLFSLDTIMNGELIGPGVQFKVDSSRFMIPTEYYDCGLVYAAQVQTNCLESTSFPTSSTRFQTPCVNTIEDPVAVVGGKLTIVPNPSRGQSIRLEISQSATTSEAILEVFQLNGQRLLEKRISLLGGNTILPLQLPDGLTGFYLVRISLEQGGVLYAKGIVE